MSAEGAQNCRLIEIGKTSVVVYLLLEDDVGSLLQNLKRGLRVAYLLIAAAQVVHGEKGKRGVEGVLLPFVEVITLKKHLEAQLDVVIVEKLESFAVHFGDEVVEVEPHFLRVLSVEELAYLHSLLEKEAGLQYLVGL